MENPSPKNPIEEEKIHEVLLLLEHLARREAVTVTMILDRLYDIGSVNLIDKKINSRSLKGITKLIAKNSKPVFKIIALRWFQKNCPKLIADWLQEQVSFENKEEAQEKPEKQQQEKITPKEVQLQVYALPPGEQKNLEVMKDLQERVKMLTRILIGAIALCGGTVLWLLTN